MDDNILINLAVEAQKNSYSPYSKITVGTALLTQNGKVFIGCNIENSSYGASVCGERTAIFKAISEGNKDFKTIAISSNLDDFVFPCGICRQVISEFSSDIKIIVTNKNKEIKKFTISELLPYAFSL